MTAPDVRGAELVGPECTCPEVRYTHRHIRPATPDVSTDTGALREAIGRTSYEDTSDAYIDPPWDVLAAHHPVKRAHLRLADAVLALPALRDLIAERDQAVAAVERVRELADQYRTLGAVLHSVPAAEAYRDVADGLGRALDGAT